MLFCICVPSKPARTQARKLEQLLLYRNTATPFDYIRALDKKPGALVEELQNARLRQYKRIGRAFRLVLGIDLGSVSVEALERLVGRKTARFFLIHSRPGLRLAILDTHILKYLRTQGVRGVPKTTPTSGKEYARLEQAYLDVLAKQGITDLAKHDLMIWTMASRKTSTPAEHGMRRHQN